MPVSSVKQMAIMHKNEQSDIIFCPTSNENLQQRSYSFQIKCKIIVSKNFSELAVLE